MNGPPLTDSSPKTYRTCPAARLRRPVRAHGQIDPAVADQHIGLYVNEFTADLGEDGYAAVRGLLTRAAAEGLVPPLGPNALRFP
ncbi:1,4-dihydroxy-6-naphtoate synthase [Streptomyces violarus]